MEGFSRRHWFWLKIDNFGCNNNIGLSSVEFDQFWPKSKGFGQHFKTLVLVTYSFLKIGFLFNKKDGTKCNKKKQRKKKGYKDSYDISTSPTKKKDKKKKNCMQ